MMMENGSSRPRGMMRAVLHPYQIALARRQLKEE
jgi:hypothetical protein